MILTGFAQKSPFAENDCVCLECETSMEAEKEPVLVAEYKDNLLQEIYKIGQATLRTCPKCNESILTDFAILHHADRMPFAEVEKMQHHIQHEYF